MLASRRGFLSFLGTGLIAAPAIVKCASLMPVRGIIMPVDAISRFDTRSLLEDWGRQLRRDEIIDAFYAMPDTDRHGGGMFPIDGDPVYVPPQASIGPPVIYQEYPRTGDGYLIPGPAKGWNEQW